MYRAQFLSKCAEKTLRAIAREGRKRGGIRIEVYDSGTLNIVTSVKCMADPFIFAMDGATGLVDVVVIYAASRGKSTLVDLDAMGCKPFDSSELPADWFERNRFNILLYTRD